MISSRRNEGLNIDTLCLASEGLVQTDFRWKTLSIVYHLVSERWNCSGKAARNQKDNHNWPLHEPCYPKFDPHLHAPLWSLWDGWKTLDRSHPLDNRYMACLLDSYELRHKFWLFWPAVRSNLEKEIGDIPSSICCIFQGYGHSALGQEAQRFQVAWSRPL